MRALRCPPPILALALAGVTAASSAHAEPEGDPAEARQHYASGTQAFSARRYVEAALEFEAAAEKRPHAVALYTAALAWEQANKPDRAADAFGRSLESPGLAAQQATVARERLAALERTLGTVSVMAPQGWRVGFVGLTEVPAPARLHAAPGTHTLLVRPPGRALERQDVVVEAGQVTRLELEDTPEASAADGAPDVIPRDRPRAARHAAVASSPGTGSGPGARRAVGFVAVGMGAAALGAGAVLGLSALDARDAYLARPSHDTYDHATSLQTLTNVALVAGGVLAVGGVVLVLWPERDATERPRTPPAAAGLTLAPTGNGAVLRGSF